MNTRINMFNTYNIFSKILVFMTDIYTFTFNKNLWKERRVHKHNTADYIVEYPRSLSQFI